MGDRGDGEEQRKWGKQRKWEDQRKWTEQRKLGYSGDKGNGENEEIKD